MQQPEKKSKSIYRNQRDASEMRIQRLSVIKTATVESERERERMRMRVQIVEIIL